MVPIRMLEPLTCKTTTRRTKCSRCFSMLATCDAHALTHAREEAYDPRATCVESNAAEPSNSCLWAEIAATGLFQSGKNFSSMLIRLAASVGRVTGAPRSSLKEPELTFLRAAGRVQPHIKEV